MAATLKGTVVSLLLLLLSSFSQGVHGVEVLHLESVRAVEGQNITLPCLLGEKEGRKPVISQVEWRKKGELEDHKLVVYNPSFGETLIWPNVALDVVWYKDKDKDKLMGTSLVLKGVEARDSGRYICDITTYPNGSIRKVTRLRVEGPADTVTPSTNVTESTGTSTNVTESTGTSTNVTESTGTGTNVTESTGTSTNVTESTGTSTNVTESTGTSTNVTESTGTSTNVTESTGTSTNVTESTGTSTNVTESTGTSTNVTSELTEPGEMTTPIANLSVTPDTLTSSTVQEVNTEARPKGSEVNSSTDSPVRVPSTAQSGSTYPPKVQSDQPTPWSVQSDGRQGNESESETPSGGGQGGSVSPTLNPEKSTLAGEKEDHTLGTYYTSTASHGDDVVIETGPSSGQRYVVVWVLLPVLVLLIVVGFLYRRYIIQKKMDLPPPFKPPPPPVKYSSLRADDVPMTDILT